MHISARQYSDQIYCSHCERTWDVNDPEPPECEVYLSPDTPPEKRTAPSKGETILPVALVGFLAAKLALYEPDCPTVKEALEWLRDANSK